VTAAIHVVARFPHKSGLLEDQVNQTWNFIAPDDTPASLAIIQGQLNQFYFVAHSPGQQAVVRWFANCLSRTVQGTYDFYKPTGPLTGSPIASLPINLLPAPVSGAKSLPSEVAICLSFASVYGSAIEFQGETRPRARHRGRVFLGPLESAAITDDSLGRAIPTTNMVADITGAAGFLSTTSTVSWSQWSRKDGIFRAVSRYWVDDAFDTQRRRGEKARSRTSAGSSLLERDADELVHRIGVDDEASD
jgi:hypothetical protein